MPERDYIAWRVTLRKLGWDALTIARFIKAMRDARPMLDSLDEARRLIDDYNKLARPYREYREMIISDRSSGCHISPALGH